FSSRSHPSSHSFPPRRSSDLSNTAQLTHCSWLPFQLKSISKYPFLSLTNRILVTSFGFTTSLAEQPANRASSPSVALSYRNPPRSEEHTSELQSRFDLVCRLL